MPDIISAQMLALTKKNSVVREMFEEGKRLAAIHGAENVFDFSIGNPYFPPPESVKNAIVEVLETDPPNLIHGYMSNAGYPDVREAVAQNLNTRFATNFTGGNILMTSGASGGLNVILKTLLNEGDEVICQAPLFLEYGNYIANFGATMVIVPPNPPSFQPDPEAIKNCITPKTRALILNSPNNPTGAIYTAETITQIAAVLEEKQSEYGTSIFIISDEPYRELAYDGATVPWLTGFYRNTIVGYSWSKSLSLPGERIGYLVIPSEADAAPQIFEAATIANRILGFVNAPSLIQRAVARCLDTTTDITAYDNNRKLLYNGLLAAGFTCANPQGTFYLWLKTPIDDKDFAAMAKKHNILLVPGTSFACPGYVRVAYCVSGQTIKNALPGFAKLAAELGLKQEVPQ